MSPTWKKTSANPVTVHLVGSGSTLLDAVERVLNERTSHPVHRAELRDLPETLAEGDVVFAAFDHPAKTELQELGNLCAATPLIPLRTHARKVYVGPAGTPDVTAGFRDLVGRRLAGAREVQDDEAFWAHVDHASVSPAELEWIAETASDLFVRWTTEPGKADLTNGEIELDPDGRLIERRPVLPLPDRKAPAFSRVTASTGLVSAQTGIVLGVQDVPEDATLSPPGLHLAVAEVAEMRRLFSWPNDRRAFGSSWDGPEGAHAAAVGEAVERYCGNWPGPHTEIVSTTFDALRARGEDALDPDRLALYSSSQYAARGFPFKPFLRSSPAAWVHGWSLTRERPVWVPAFLAFVAWRHHCPEEARYCYPNLTGVAAGTSLDSATVSGLEEVIERDTSMTWWSNRVSLPPVVVPEQTQQRMRTAGHRFEVRVLALPNEFALPIAAGIVRDRETGWLTVGTAVRPDFEAATYKAVAEAYSLQSSCRLLDDEKAASRIVQANVQSARNLKPWRQDRAYLASYRDDFHDVVDLMCQLQVNLDPRAVEQNSDRLWSAQEPIDAPTDRLPDRSLGALRHRVEERDHEVIRVDLTSPDVAAAGLHVVRVVVPGLVANFPAAFPMWGRGRISRAGAERGWPGAPFDEDELSVFPMPHA
ncbi:YcaO-like family protein [Amycolatopsis japonica]